MTQSTNIFIAAAIFGTMCLITIPLMIYVARRIFKEDA